MLADWRYNMKEVILDILEMFIDSLYGSAFICVGVAGFVNGMNQKDLMLKFFGIILTCMGIVGIRCGIERRANKKYVKKEKE